MIDPSEVVAQALIAELRPIDTLAVWLERHRRLAREHDEPILCAIAAGAGADRLAWAFGSGYQAAGRKLCPGLPPDRIGALCATEQGGTQPSAIATKLERGALYGTKTFVTFGLEAEVLIVIASEGTNAEGKNRLRAVLVERGAPGLTFEPLGETPFVPEISHATVRFDGVPGRALDGDGYLAYLKPFRTIEDTHVLAAAMAHVVTLGNLARLGESFAERGAAVMMSLIQISRLPVLAPATHLALAGTQDILQSLVTELDSHLDGLPEAIAELWMRDRPLFSVAGTVRAKRRQAAWARLKDR